MNKMQRQVEQFNKAIKANPSVQLVVDLIKEEVAELIEGIEEGDAVKTIDGACDSIVVILGAIMHRVGVDLEPFFDEVQRTNMQKATGPIREDGKRLKPEGWKPPRLDVLLAIARAPCRHCKGLGMVMDYDESTECSKCNGTATRMPFPGVSVEELWALRRNYVHNTARDPKYACSKDCKICYPPTHKPGARL